MISVAAIGVLSNTLSIETGDLRKGSAFDRVKATFNQALKLGDLPESKLTAEYDSGDSSLSLDPEDDDSAGR